MAPARGSASDDEASPTPPAVVLAFVAGRLPPRLDGGGVRPLSATAALSFWPPRLLTTAPPREDARPPPFLSPIPCCCCCESANKLFEQQPSLYRLSPISAHGSGWLSAMSIRVIASEPKSGSAKALATSGRIAGAVMGGVLLLSWLLRDCC